MSETQTTETPAVSTEVIAEGTVTPTTEAVPEVKEAAPAPTEGESQLSAKFAALSRKEKQIRDRERAVQQQMNEMQARLKAFEAEKAEADKWKQTPERLKKDPLGVFKESGLSLEQLTEMLLNGGKPTESMERSELETRVLSKMEELEKKMAEKEAKETEQKYEAQLNAFVQELTTFVNDTPDYELIRSENAVDTVYQVIEQHHAETGEILSHKAAADAVEEYLFEQAKKMLEREKIKKLVSATSPAKEAPKAAQEKPVTLSNTQSAQVEPKVQRTLSAEESKAEAAKLIRWQD